MNICGVVAEYNPFHNGHAYQLQEAREKTKADFVIVLMSGYFTQRGDPAIMAPNVRAKMALDAGADIVCQLPTIVSVREADTFASCSIDIFNAMQCVTHISFGAETDDIELLWHIAQILETESDSFDRCMKENLQKPCSHAEALSLTLNMTHGIPMDVLRQSNNILAVSYLRGLLRSSSKIEPALIHRKKSYLDNEVDTQFPSAMAIRKAITRGDWLSIRQGMPDYAYSQLMHEVSARSLCKPEAFDSLLRLQMVKACNKDLRGLPDAHEGIENNILQYARDFHGKESLALAASTRHYSNARMSRLICHILLDTCSYNWPEFAMPVQLLGYRKRAAEVVDTIGQAKTMQYSSGNAYYFLNYADKKRRNVHSDYENNVMAIWQTGANARRRRPNVVVRNDDSTFEEEKSGVKRRITKKR